MTIQIKSVRPLYDRVLIKRDEGESMTASGLIIPDNAKEEPKSGTVIAAGNGTLDDSGKLRPLTVKSGDKVLFAKWGGTEIEIEGDKYLIMKESDILAIIGA